VFPPHDWSPPLSQSGTFVGAGARLSCAQRGPLHIASQAHAPPTHAPPRLQSSALRQGGGEGAGGAGGGAGPPVLPEVAPAYARLPAALVFK
jgi:hypothetical protein